MMAEFCVKCWNEMNNTNYSPNSFILCNDFCENCGKYTKTIVVKKSYFYKRILRIFLIPIAIVLFILTLPYYAIKSIFKRH